MPDPRNMLVLMLLSSCVAAEGEDASSAGRDAARADALASRDVVADTGRADVGGVEAGQRDASIADRAAADLAGGDTAVADVGLDSGDTGDAPGDDAGYEDGGTRPGDASTSSWTIVAVEPAPGATDVAVHSPIEAVASRALDPGSVVAGAITLGFVAPASGSAAHGTASLSGVISHPAADRVALAPSPRWPLLSHLQATVPAGVATAGGQPLARDHGWSFWTRDGAWSEPALHADAGDNVIALDVGWDALGQVHAVWIEAALASGDRTVAAGVFDADTAELTPLGLLALGGATLRRVSLAVAADGSAVAVWEESDRLHGAHRTAAGVWSQARPLQERGVVIDRALAINPAGEAVLVWALEDPDLAVEARSYLPLTATWTPVEVLATPEREMAVAATITRDGDLLAAWQPDFAPAEVALVAAPGVEGVWGAPFTVATLASPGPSPHLFALPDGGALVTWGESVQRGQLWVDQLWWAPYLASSQRFGPEELLSASDSGGISEVKLTLGPSGDRTLSWVDDGALVVSAWDSATEYWSAPTLVPQVHPADTLWMVSGPAGNRVALWSENLVSGRAFGAAHWSAQQQLWHDDSGAPLPEGVVLSSRLAPLAGGRAILLYLEAFGPSAALASAVFE